MAPSQFGGALLLLTIPFPLSIPPWPPRITWVATFCATIQPVGCRSRARLDQGRTVDLALHSSRAPSFFFRHTILGGHSFPSPFHTSGGVIYGNISGVVIAVVVHRHSARGGEDLHGIWAGGCSQSLSSGCSSMMSSGSPTRRFLDITCSDSAL